MDGRRVPALRIGWIGVGKMGNPIVRALLDAGLTVTLLEPRLENRASAVAAGGRVAHSVADLVAGSEMVFTTLNDDDALHRLMFGDESLATHLAPGQVFVDMSTISPRLSEDIAAVLANRGVPYLRAPISGSTATAGARSLTVIASGPEDAWRPAEPVLSVVASKTLWIGSGEEARYAKLAVNVLLGSTAALLREALAVGRAGGLGSDVLMDVLCESVVGSPLLHYKRDALAARDFEPAFSVAQMIKDLELIGEVADHSGQRLDLVQEVRRRFEQARRAGFADQDYFVVVRDTLGDDQAGASGAGARMRSTSS